MSASQYVIISKGGVGEFKVLSANNDYLTVFSYKNWFSSNGSAETDLGLVEIKAKNGWETSFDVSCAGSHVGEITFNWKGNIIINFVIDGVSKNFQLRSISLKSDWVLENENEKALVNLHSDTHWTKVDYRYDVTIHATDEIPVVLLLIACGYGTNLNMSMISALLV